VLPTVGDGRQITVSARIVAGIVAAAEAVGVEVAPVLRALEIDAAVLRDPDARIPIATEEALWDEMARRSGDPCFGLHAQGHIPPGTLDVLDYAVRSSANLRQAYENLVRYNRLVHDIAEFTLSVADGVARLTQHFRGDPRGASWQVTDYSLGGLVLVTRQLIGDDWNPIEVRMTHPAPGDPGPYRELFRVTPRFNCDANELAIDATLLERPVASADPLLHRVLRRHADALLEKLPRSEGIVEQVREILARSLCGGDPGIDAVARRLHMSPRTLQRRLAGADTSHQELLEAMRREMALRLLDEGGVAISEVAFLLGYSQPSAFHRAFRRWTGSTPAEFRSRNR
jgi:AraC-like DNA-binding protein